MLKSGGQQTLASQLPLIEELAGNPREFFFCLRLFPREDTGTKTGATPFAGDDFSAGQVPAPFGSEHERHLFEWEIIFQKDRERQLDE